MTHSEKCGNGKKEADLAEAKDFLRENLEIEFDRYFGLTDGT